MKTKYQNVTILLITAIVLLATIWLYGTTELPTASAAAPVQVYAPNADWIAARPVMAKQPKGDNCYFTLLYNHNVPDGDNSNLFRSCFVTPPSAAEAGTLVRNRERPEKSVSIDAPAQIVDEPAGTTPEAEQPEEKPEEKTCKNKNSGKDGTPDECNAGGGQEKHNN